MSSSILPFPKLVSYYLVESWWKGEAIDLVNLYGLEVESVFLNVKSTNYNMMLSKELNKEPSVILPLALSIQEMNK